MVARTVALALLCLAGMVSLASAQVTTPPPGSAERKAILDAVRPMAEAEVGAPVEFTVNDIRVLGEWAFISVNPQRKGGAPIEWAYTRYQSQWEDGAFDATVTALLRQTPLGWLVYAYDLGATDVVWTPWPDWYPAAPPEIFPGG